MNGEKGSGAGGMKLFVGGLHLDNTTDESLAEYFGAYGEVTDPVVMRDKETKKSRGFGFVTFTDVAAAKECLGEAPHVVDSKKVEVKPAVPLEESKPTSRGSQPKKVFLGGLSRDTLKEDIMAVFRDLGARDVQIMTKKENDEPRGFAFLFFDDCESADRVCKQRHFTVKDREVELKKARPKEEMNQDSVSGDRSDIQRGGYQGGGYPGREDPYGRYYKMARDYPRMGAYGSDYYMRGDYGQGGGYGMGGGGYGDRYAAYRYPAQGYDMSAYANMYSQTAGMGSYNQSASGYGPASRGSYGGGEKESGGGRGTGGYHPYRRH